MKKSFFLLLLLISFIHNFFGQIPGTWEIFASYRNINSIEISNNKIFAAAQNGILILDRATHETSTWDKTNTLSNTKITSIKFSPNQQKLIVGYSNGFIDILNEQGQRQTISTVAENLAIVQKQINDIELYNGKIFLATGFGVIKIDENTLQIEELIKLSEDYQETNCTQIEIFQDTVFVASKNIIYNISTKDNMNFFSLWKETTFPDSITSLTSGYNLYLTTQNESSQSSKLWKYNNGFYNIDKDELPFNTKVKAIDNNFILLKEKGFALYNEYGTLLKSFSYYSNGKIILANDVLQEGNQWIIADKTVGLTIDLTGESIYTNCPFSDQNTDIAVSKTKLIVLAKKNFTDSLAGYNGVISIMQNNQWNNIITGADSLCCIAIDPANEEHYFVGSLTEGLIEIKDSRVINHYTAQNSNLEANTKGYTEINSLLFSNDTLWIYNNSPTPIKYLTPAKEIKKISSSSVGAHRKAYHMIKTVDGNIWATLGAEGYLATNYNENISKKFYPIRSYGGTTWLHEIFDIAEDKENIIWTGGRYGMGYLYDNDFTASTAVVWPTVEITVNDTTVSFYLFMSTNVGVIRIDPANRKWVGAINSGGAFLLNEQCSEQIHHFSQKNSPLPGDIIYDIEINSSTGKVYLQTDNGLACYTSDASNGQNSFANLKVYPNPVRPGYSGTVVMEGLMDKTLIKITDLQGNVVTELRSQGGRAVWNLKNLNGQRVASGIYLIMCSTENNRNKCIKKLMIIN